MTITQPGRSISEVAAATGLSSHTLRYYERAGLMLYPVGRAPSTHRRYSDPDVSWVGFLSKLRSTGMPISTVREYVELARSGDATSEARMELLLRHRVRVLAQLQEITRSLSAIDTKISIYKEKVTS